jgi:TfoX/Sxy family transcriptional regulator of competence genes
MKMPKASADAEARFRALVPGTPEVEVRRMFGQPAAFYRGQMFLGVFGTEVFLRLSEADRSAASQVKGTHPFEPMPGRPMREYVVFPESVLGDPASAKRWRDRSVAFARTLPPKVAEKRPAR